MPEQRVALITGGAKRVGRAIVERLHQADFAVAFTYLGSQTQAAELSRATGAMAIQADLTNPYAAVEKIGNEFSRTFKRLDVLVNNASLYQPALLQQADLALSRRLMAIHFESPLLLASHFEKLLKLARGHIINLLDVMVERPWPKYLGYCASKAALWNLTLSLSRELAPEVTVNGIAPGVVDWPDDFPLVEQQRYLSRVPLARAGTPTDVAQMVHFLSTAGAYITGQVIRIDGGRSIT